MIKRDDFSLYLCQLCILRSQCPKLARNFLDEKRENEAALDRLKQVEDDDTNRIPGIRVVTGTIKKQMDGASEHSCDKLVLDTSMNLSNRMIKHENS